jgi:hypothetical protein
LLHHGVTMDSKLLEKIIGYIDDYQAAHDGLSPTVREIAKDCYMSNALVMRCLDFLQAQGKLTRQAGKARSVRLVNGGRRR